MNPFDRRPIVVALAGPNGAGKSTFYEAHLRASGLRFVNADDLARELAIGAYRAAEVAAQVRADLLAAGESFVFETVFSDPVQDKIHFLKSAEARGYTVVLCFIGLDNAALSDERVALRTLMGGHDVPHEKLLARYPRSLDNLQRGMQMLPIGRVFDNSRSNRPHRLVAALDQGRIVDLRLPSPGWLAPLLGPHLPIGPELRVERAAQNGSHTTLILRVAPKQTLRVRYHNPKRPPAAGERVLLSPQLTLRRAGTR